MYTLLYWKRKEIRDEENRQGIGIIMWYVTGGISYVDAAGRISGKS